LVESLLAIFWILKNRRGQINCGCHRLNKGFYRLGANLATVTNNLLPKSDTNFIENQDPNGDLDYADWETELISVSGI
jgi:hypothetical protein